ncbi:dynein axonemal heavy chain 12-like [Saccoglossus kowalevskii]
MVHEINVPSDRKHCMVHEINVPSDRKHCMVHEINVPSDRRHCMVHEINVPSDRRHYMVHEINVPSDRKHCMVHEINVPSDRKHCMVHEINVPSDRGHCMVHEINVPSDRKHCADPNSAACDGGTPLFICTQENHIECLELLMKHGADVTKKTQDNYLPLHIAAHKGHYRCLELLLEKTNNDMLEGTLNPIMLTMFGLDVYTNCAELLVNNGIKLNTRTHFSVNPLEDILDEDNDFSLYNDVFLAPLNVAVIRNEENLVRFFLNHGADTNFVPYPCTMCLASHSSVSVSILDLLIRHGARPTCTYKRRPAKDNEKWIDYFPLLTALNSEPSNKIKRLFDSGFHLEHCLFQQCCSDLKCFFTALNDYFIAHKNRSILLNQLVLLALDYVGTVRLCSHAMNQLCIEHPSYSLIQSIIDNPRTLQQLCRVRILELLGTSLILKKDEVLRELILPDILKKFLIHEL